MSDTLDATSQGPGSKARNIRENTASLAILGESNVMDMNPDQGIEVPSQPRPDFLISGGGPRHHRSIHSPKRSSKEKSDSFYGHKVDL